MQFLDIHMQYLKLTKFLIYSLGTVVKEPTKKSSAASNIISSKTNCNFITHLTPATLITPNNSTAAIAKPLAAHVLSAPIKFAIDSPKPKTLRAQPTA